MNIFLCSNTNFGYHIHSRFKIYTKNYMNTNSEMVLNSDNSQYPIIKKEKLHFLINLFNSKPPKDNYMTTPGIFQNSPFKVMACFIHENPIFKVQKHIHHIAT
jgi:hypothetical protein